MLTIVCCTGCGKSGMFDISLTFDPEHRHCKSCGHQESQGWHYQFCILSCFMDWLTKNKVADLGFPCRDCIDVMGTGKPSGFAHGFKENGTCKTCKGKKTVKGRRTSVDPMAAMQKKIGKA